MKNHATIWGVVIAVATAVPSWSGPAAVGVENGATAHPSGADLEIRWTLLANVKDGQSHRARWAITNHGTAPLPKRGWTIYFNMLHLASLNPILEAPLTVKITHFSGDLFTLQPTASCPPLAPGATLTFEYRGVQAINKPSWGPDGLYIVFENELGQEEKPSLIGKTIIDPFTRPEQIHRGQDDQTPIPTPAYLHRQNQKLTLLPADRVGKVTPTPVKYEERGARLSLSADWTFRHQKGLRRDASYLARMLTGVLGTDPKTEVGTTPEKKTIVLRLGEVAVGGQPKAAGSEAYALTAAPSTGVEIVGADADGVFYGIQTFLQLLPPTAWAGTKMETVFPAVQIQDAPRFAYRGQHIDVSHNFHSKQSILQMLDRMAFYKLNKFHFQLSDDEGWRIEIPDLPDLTAVGGGRAHTRDHDGVLHPTYGAGPFREPATHGTGFYTRQDFIEILQHAHALHIDVIPEINLPLTPAPR